MNRSPHIPTTAQSQDRPRRFYAVVTVETADGGFAVRLDGRTPRTPGGRPLVLPTEPLAELIAEEWRAQTDTIDASAMPATKLAHTAIDVVAGAREKTRAGIAAYAETDLLCYVAESPASLVARQQAVWGALLDWAEAAHGLVFHRVAGIIHRPQPPETLSRLSALLAPLDQFALAGLAFAAPLLGSAVLALALRDGRLDAAAAMAASRLDEIYEEERWGVDEEAAQRAARLAAEALMAERWFAALAG
jgi:chaperone required for assembly of F1-ATPase